MIGDFNAHSPKWGHKDTNAAGNEMEDLLNISILELIYNDTDPPTYLHFNVAQTTPDLLLVFSDISANTKRITLDIYIYTDILFSILCNTKLWKCDIYIIIYISHIHSWCYKVLKIVYHCIAPIINNTQLHSSVSELFSIVLRESVLYCVCLVYDTRYA